MADNVLKSVEASAPGRAGIVGNPSDLYGGSMLSCALSARAVCRIEPADVLALSARERTLEATSELDLAPVGDHLDIVRAVLRAHLVLPHRDHFHISITTDIPVQAGLAGSTALLCAMIAALQASRGTLQHPHALVETVRLVERNDLGIQGGFQDATMTVFGGLRFMDFRNRETLAQGPEEPYVVAEAITPPGMPFVVANTGVPHHSGTVHKSLRQRWIEGETAVVEGYRRIAALAQRGKRALLDADWPALAAAMNENHAIQRDLGGSGEPNERLIAAALNGGALAAKLAGAGGGGTIIALTLEPERTAAALVEADGHLLEVLDSNAPGVTVSGG